MTPLTKSVEPTEESDEAYRSRLVTIPNIICIVRLAGALSLVYFASNHQINYFIAIFTILSLSDWVDGRIARWLKQRSDFGARLDSFADSVLYGMLFIGMLFLKGDILRREAGWWIIAMLSYGLTTGAGLWKYGRVPSYHTYGAKVSQWLVLIGALCLLFDYSVWPFRIAMLVGTLTNLEATAITWYLPTWHADVLSFIHALKISKTTRPNEDEK